MTGTVTIEPENTTMIGMIVITPPTIIGGMTNGESMQIRIGATQTGKDIRTIGAIIGEEISEEKSVGNRPKIINESRIEI